MEHTKHVKLDRHLKILPCVSLICFLSLYDAYTYAEVPDAPTDTKPWVSERLTLSGRALQPTYLTIS